MNIRELERAVDADPKNVALYKRLLTAYVRTGYLKQLQAKRFKNEREKDLLLDLLIHVDSLPPLLKYYLTFRANKTNPAIQLELVHFVVKSFDGDFSAWYPHATQPIHPVDINENSYLKIYLNPKKGEGQYPYRTINAQDFFNIYHNEEYVENDNPILLLSYDLTGTNNNYFDADQINEDSAIYIQMDVSDKTFLKGVRSIIYGDKLSRDWLKKQFKQEWPSMAEDFKEEIERNYPGLTINLEPRALKALKKVFEENAESNDLIFFNRDDEITAHYGVIAQEVSEEEIDMLPDVEWGDEDDWY